MALDQARWQRIEEAFAEAVELRAEERRAFCERFAAGDAELLSELLTLVEAHFDQSSWFDDSTQPEGRDTQQSSAKTFGKTTVGAWRVGPLLGRGGSGEVFLASRIDGHFEQQAAIKILSPDANGQLERFRAERQVLARLEHPGIARLLDGGTTADGHDFAVMEYVSGTTLTAYCASIDMPLEDRLRLFMQICEAVSHAHQHLIVHRDLKPANIMVGEDGRIKLLDFGIAKQLDLASALKAEVTIAPLTPDYAAPEQVTGEPVTTATDVYALGVILFELLTGERPWPRARPSLARLVQLIVNSTPPLASVTARAGRDAPVAWTRLRGDLDCIVAKCLRKEAGARYSTVHGLQRDVERHLAHQPVTAREGGTFYVVSRTVRRNVWPTAAVLAIVASLSVGIAVSTVAAHRAAVERDIAKLAAGREEAVRLNLTSMFREAIAEHPGQNLSAKGMLDHSARRVIDQYRDDPLLMGRVVMTLANLYGALQDDEGQAPMLEAYLAAAGPNADAESLASARQALAQVELERGHVVRATELLGQADKFWGAAPERYREQSLEGLGLHGRLWRAQGNLAASIRAYRQAIEGRLLGPDMNQRELANLYNSLAITLIEAGSNDEALAAYRSALAIYDRLGLSDELGPLVIQANTGTLAFRTGHLAEAEDILKKAIEGQRRRAGESASLAAALGNLGATLTERGRMDEAGAVLRDANDVASRVTDAASPLAVQNRLYLDILRMQAGAVDATLSTSASNLALAELRLGPEHVLTLRIRLLRAQLLLRQRRPADALAAFQATVPALAKMHSAGEPWLASAYLGAGDALQMLRRPAEAEAVYLLALDHRRKSLWNDSWKLAQVDARLGEAYLALGRATDGRALLTHALSRLEAQLGREHPETERARAALGAAPVATAG